MWFFCGVCVFTVTSHIVRYATDIGIPHASAAIVVSIMGGISIPGRLAVGKLSDIIGRKQTVFACSLLFAVGMFVLLQTRNLTMLYVFAVVFGLALGGTNSSVGALAADIFNLRSLGVIVGILDAGYGLGGALGPLFAGFVYYSTGTYSLAFILDMVFMAVSAGLILAIKMPEAKTSR
jgi:MFS family permease